MRLADYFGRAFAKVNASQFPWMKIIKESSVAKMVDVSLSLSLFRDATINKETFPDNFDLELKQRNIIHRRDL